MNLNIGIAVSGFFISLLRLLCLGIFKDTYEDENLKNSSLVYFLSSSGINVLGLVSHYLFINSDFFKEKAKKITQDSMISLDFNEISMYAIDAEPVKNSSHNANQVYLNLNNRESSNIITLIAQIWRTLHPLSNFMVLINATVYF